MALILNEKSPKHLVLVLTRTPELPAFFPPAGVDSVLWVRSQLNLALGTGESACPWPGPCSQRVPGAHDQVWGEQEALFPLAVSYCTPAPSHQEHSGGWKRRRPWAISPRFLWLGERPSKWPHSFLDTHLNPGSHNYTAAGKRVLLHQRDILNTTNLKKKKHTADWC